MSLCNTADSRHDLTASAIAALKGVVVNKCLLDWVELSIFRQPLDSSDLMTIKCRRKYQAAIDAPPVQKDGARAALTTIASLFGARQLQALSKKVEQGDSGLDIHDMWRPIDRHSCGRTDIKSRIEIARNVRRSKRSGTDRTTGYRSGGCNRSCLEKAAARR